MGLFKKRRQATWDAIERKGEADRASKAYTDFEKWAKLNGFSEVPGAEGHTIPIWAYTTSDVAIRVLPLFAVGVSPPAIESYSVTLNYLRLDETDDDYESSYEVAPRLDELQQLVDKVNQYAEED